MSKGSDQTTCMRRLIWGFAWRTYHIVGNLMHWLILYMKKDVCTAIILQWSVRSLWFQLSNSLKQTDMNWYAEYVSARSIENHSALIYICFSAKPFVENFLHPSPIVQLNLCKTATLKKTENWFSIMQVKSIAECSNGEHSQIEYCGPSLSYHFSLRCLFWIFLSGRFTQVLLYVIPQAPAVWSLKQFWPYSKTCLKHPLKKKTKYWFSR